MKHIISINPINIYCTSSCSIVWLSRCISCTFFHTLVSYFCKQTKTKILLFLIRSVAKHPSHQSLRWGSSSTPRSARTRSRKTWPAASRRRKRKKRRKSWSLKSTFQTIQFTMTSSESFSSIGRHNRPSWKRCRGWRAWTFRPNDLKITSHRWPRLTSTCRRY